MFSISQNLKNPLYTATRNLLGEWMLEEGQLQKSTSLCLRVSSVAKIALYAIGLIFSLPAWTFGELLEVCTKDGRALFNDDVNLPNALTESIALDPSKTKFMGTAVSTFQATSDKTFCKGSALHKALSGDDLHLGEGVDILTLEGQKQTADRLEEMEANAFRFSVEWPDVEKHGLDRYIEAAKYFHARGFKLMITLDHWMGNGKVDFLENPHDQKAFVEYAAEVYRALRPYASHFLTFNEPHVDANQKYVMGDLPPKKMCSFWHATKFAALKLEAHRAVYKKLHLLELDYQKRGDANREPLQIGLSHQAICMASNSRLNLIARITAFVITHIFHESFMRMATQPKMKKCLDFIGIQYYARPLAGRNGWQIVDSIARKTKLNPEAWMCEGMKYRFDPVGILPVLLDVHKRLNKEIVVTETGTPGEINAYAPSRYTPQIYYDKAGKRVSRPKAIEDKYSRKIEKRKAVYYRHSLQAMRSAQDEGVNLSGVFFWTLFDNLEWQHGYKPSCLFGILARNRETGIVRITEGFETIRKIFSQTRLLMHAYSHAA